MEVRNVIETLVLVVGLCGWAISIPQFRLLLKTKSSHSNSLFVSIGGLLSQVIFFTGALLQKNWTFSFSFGAGLVTSVCMISVIAYYRKYPGGKNTADAPKQNRLVSRHLWAPTAPRTRRLSKPPARHPTRLPTESRLLSMSAQHLR